MQKLGICFVCFVILCAYLPSPGAVCSWLNFSPGMMPRLPRLRPVPPRPWAPGKPRATLPRGLLPPTAESIGHPHRFLNRTVGSSPVSARKPRHSSRGDVRALLVARRSWPQVGEVMMCAKLCILTELRGRKMSCPHRSRALLLVLEVASTPASAASARSMSGKS